MLATHIGGDLPSELLRITVLSLAVAGAGTFLAALVGVPLGVWLALHPSRAARWLRIVSRTLYGMPPVVVGLLVFLLLSRAGPLGSFGLLFTAEAMVVAQALLVLPLVLGLSMAAVEAVDPALHETALGLGARGWRLVRTFGHEAREGIASAVLVGFGRAVSEVGAVIIVGGNILFHTRVLTTAIVEETDAGNTTFALALGAILLALALGTALFVGRLEEGGAAAA
ncbi:MAG: ABC transporter permease [Halobacteriales archaeon]|nr:ABC transporter permease [Halobacteriales archaeon]